MSSAGRWIAAATLAWLVASHVEAQVTPPELIEMPDVRAPGDARTVEIEIVIDREGRARIDECSEPEPVCARIEEALERARFVPARREDEPVPARTRLAVRLVPEVIEAEPAPPVSPVPDMASEEPPLGVTAEVERETPGADRIELEEARDIPGALGDPFRAVLILPGVVPLIDGLPYFYLRGAPPSGTIYVYDDIVVPALYHLAAGPAVIHPQMVGAIDVHSGVAPIRYGGHSGGVVVGEGPGPRSEDVFGEAEVRLLDVNGFVHGRVGDLTLSAATRIGYPGLLLSAVSPEVDLAYWDYQARGRLALGGGHRLELVAFGSYDMLSTVITGSDGDTEQTKTTLTFHRVELRSILARPRTEVGFAIRAGHDESSFIGGGIGPSTGLGLILTSAGARFWVAHREGDLRLRVGGDLVGAGGRFFAPAPSMGDDPVLGVLSQARQRLTTSLYAHLEWRPLRELAFVGGVRGDLWIVPALYEAAIDPRLRVIWEPDPALSLHIAGGVARQPSVFVLPLPGLSELPLTNGLVTAVQSEIGASYRVRVDDLRLSATVNLFLHHYDNLLLPDLFNDIGPGCNTQGLCRAVGDGGFRVDSWSYGAELSLRGELGRHFAARLAYTLSGVESDPYDGEVAYTPSYDVRHVLNVVLRYDSRAGFVAGVRAFLRSGTVQGFTYVTGDDLTLERYEQRLPAFARLDAMVAYGWDAGWADLRVTLEWLNATFAVGGEPQGLDCGDRTGPPAHGCTVTRLPPIFFPNLGLRGTFR